jgi:ABC-type dipeptide/oligopeptide/nickel transport system permease subunit/ABC-type dipeptide/oligopeptide/nickel transport system permease component
MDSKCAILAAVRILFFFLAVFLVANLVFFQFFVVSGGFLRTLSGVGDPAWRGIIADDLALDGSLPEQYVNFMAKTLSGEFFLSSAVRKFVPTSEFVYASALTTAGEVISVLLIAFAAAGIYGYLASGWSTKLRGKIMLSLALVGAVSFVVPVLLCVQMVMLDLGVDAFIRRPFVDSVVMASIPVSAVFVFIVEGWLRRIGPVDLRKPHDLFVKLASARGFSAVFPIFLVYAMACVLFADAVAFRGEALGGLILDAVWNRDFQVLIACIFVTAVMLLTMLLAADLLAIYASRGASRRSKSCGLGSDEADSGKTAFFEGVTRPAALDLWRAFRKSGVGMFALIVLVILLALGALAPFLSTVQDPQLIENREPNVIWERWINPLPPSLTPSPYTGFIHPLGTDHVGRDVYSLLLYDSLGSIGSALVIAVLAVIIGMGAAFARAFAQYVDGSEKEIAGWFGWLLSDVLLAVPIFLVFAVIIMTPTSEILVLIALAAFLLASFGKGYAASLLLCNDRQPSATDYGPPLKALSVSEVMHVGKYCFLFCFFSIAFVEFIIHSVELLGIGWVDMLEGAYSYGAFYRGTWWIILPPMVMIGLAAASIFIIIDRLERILLSWSAPTETDSAQASDEWMMDSAD